MQQEKHCAVEEIVISIKPCKLIYQYKPDDHHPLATLCDRVLTQTRGKYNSIGKYWVLLRFDFDTQLTLRVDKTCVTFAKIVITIQRAKTNSPTLIFSWLSGNIFTKLQQQTLVRKRAKNVRYTGWEFCIEIRTRIHPVWLFSGVMW